MTDIDDLIAEAREQAAYLRGVSRDGSMPYSGELLGSLADALVSVRAERDAALARITDLEDSRDGTTIVKLAEAEARIAEAAKLHQPEPFHDEPTESFCKTCQRTSGVWPCGTAIALGLNEGEHDD